MNFPKYRTIRSIIADVEDYFSMLPGTLKANNRSRSLVKARKLAVHLCRNYADASWPEIADCLEKDHSSLMYLHKHSKLDVSESIAVFDNLYTLTDWINPAQDIRRENKFFSDVEFPALKTVRSIISDVERYLSLTPGTIVGRSRTKEINKARKLVITLGRQHMKMSWPRLAEILDRDHSTLIHMYYHSKLDVSRDLDIFNNLYIGEGCEKANEVNK